MLRRSFLQSCLSTITILFVGIKEQKYNIFIHKIKLEQIKWHLKNQITYILIQLDGYNFIIFLSKDNLRCDSVEQQCIDSCQQEYPNDKVYGHRFVYDDGKLQLAGFLACCNKDVTVV